MSSHQQRKKPNVLSHWTLNIIYSDCATHDHTYCSHTLTYDYHLPSPHPFKILVSISLPTLPNANPDLIINNFNVNIFKFIFLNLLVVGGVQSQIKRKRKLNILIRHSLQRTPLYKLLIEILEGRSVIYPFKTLVIKAMKSILEKHVPEVHPWTIQLKTRKLWKAPNQISKFW